MQFSQLDQRDHAILRELMRNSRITNTDLSERVNLSPSACLRRVKLLEDAGFIFGYVMLMDPVRAGVPGVAYVSVTLDQQGRASLDAFEAAAGRQPDIMECYLLAGSSDYLIRIAYRDAAHFERIHTEILTQLPGVSRLQSTLALRTVKKTTELRI